MRKSLIIVLPILFLFLAPSVSMPGNSSGSAPVTVEPQRSPSIISGDPTSGTGDPLNTILRATITNETSTTIDSSTDSTGVVGVPDEYTNVGVDANIDSLSMTIDNALRNPSLNDYHEEKFLVGGINYRYDDVAVPDFWTLDKYEPPEQHPHWGVYELNDDSNGYSGTRGFLFEANWWSSYPHDPSYGISLEQYVHAPWREVYSAEVRFRYYVTSSSNMDNEAYLYVNFAGQENEFHVFESGDSTNTWLQATMTISSGTLSGLTLPNSHLFEIGIRTDLTGQYGASRYHYVYVDELELEMDVRPYPEQIGLRVNGTDVIGSTAESVFPFVPDENGRDCYDYTSGIDLDGYNNDARPEVGTYGSHWNTTIPFEIGLQVPLDIPKGAVIERAYIETEASGAQGIVDRRVYVAGEMVGGGSIESFASHIGQTLESTYDWTEAGFDWQPDYWSSNVRYSSPDIAPLIQAIVSDNDWVSGQYVAIMLDYIYSGSYQSWNNIKGSYGSYYNQEELGRLYVHYRVPHAEDAIETSADAERYSFQYKKDITINSSKVTADLTDFPVLIDLYDTDLNDSLYYDASNLAFMVDGEFVPHEIELYDRAYSATEVHLVAWVKVPYLSSSSDTVITMLYGSDFGGDYTSPGVWDGYEIVQHMNQHPNGTNYDSTQNHHDGPSFGSMTYDDLVNGAIGQAIHFDGSNDVISVGQIDTDEWPSFTVTGWIYRDVVGDDRVFSKAISTSPSEAIVHFAVSGSSFRVRLSTDGVGGSSSSSVDASGTVGTAAWQYLAWSWSASTEVMRLYLDGNFDRSVSKDGDSVLDSFVPFCIANWQTGTGNNRFFDGMIDEIRMTQSVLSDDWIQTEFYNQDDPSTFYSVGSQQSNTAPETQNTARLYFSTESTVPVDIGYTMEMEFEGEGQSLDEDMTTGTTFYVVNNTNVEWVANVMVSPPELTESIGFIIEYPIEWKPTKVTNPLGQEKTVNTDWWYNGGDLVLNPTSIDFWGVWNIEFDSWNTVQNLQLGETGGPLSDTDTFDIGDSMKFLATTPDIDGARAGLMLTDPENNVWYSTYNQTSTTTVHHFPSFRYRRTMTISSADVDADLTNFPVLVQEVSTDFQDTAKVRADGSDIMFAQGNKVLAHEIERFQQSSGTIAAWVKLNLSSTVDTTFDMYYGNPVVDNLENPTAVWTNNYEAVFHLDENTVNGASGTTIYDSTINGYNGVHDGTARSAGIGGFAYGQSYGNGDTDQILVTNSLAPEGDVVISGWFYLPYSHTSSSSTSRLILEKYLDPDNDLHIGLVGTDYGQTVPNGTLVFKTENLNEYMYKYTTRTSWSIGWYHFACVLDASTPNNNKIYINGQDQTNAGDVGSGAFANVSFSGDWGVGGGDTDGQFPGNQGWWYGRLDEFRWSTGSRSSGWISTEYTNQQNPSAFVALGSEQERSSPDHTFTKALDTSAMAGVWTASVYYNDSGASVSTRTGIYEREFIVKHNTALSLVKPTDAVSDQLTEATAGEPVYIEVELTDSVNSDKVSGATVTINWTTPSTITLSDLGNGRYGETVDTDDLATATRWRVEVSSSHPYYNDANYFFNIDLYHETDLGYTDVTTTPVGNDFTATLVFEDIYDGIPLTGATITFDDGSPVNVVAEGGGEYNISIPTGALGLGEHTYTFNASISGELYHMSSVTITFTLRKHFTAVSVNGNFLKPYGTQTDVTVVLIDLDTGTQVPIGSVSSINFTWTGGSLIENSPIADYDFTIDSSTWPLGARTVTLSVVMLGTTYANPSNYQFDITIRAHYTSVSVSGVVVKPYGNVTPLTVILTDLDTGGSIAIGDISSFSFTWAGGSQTENSPIPSYDIVLDTSDWDVGTTSVTLAVAFSNPNYAAPSNHVFDVTIRSMDTILYHDPTDLVFAIGSDFEIYLRVNVSEPGDSYHLPVTGLTQGEFSVDLYPFTIDTTEQSVGRYKLTIASADLGVGDEFVIIVYVTPTNTSHAPDQITIRFFFREVFSSLTSPNFPQVTTPFNTDVQVTLNYTDVEAGTGITGATITSEGLTTYGLSEVGGGIYTIWINASGLEQGNHYFNLSADAGGYEAKKLEFTLLVRIAYTYAIPSVGALDIPIGNDPVFYVEYWDIDRDISIDNSSTPYTEVSSTWGSFAVVYEAGNERYRVTFFTTDSDPLQVNQIYTFNFSKGTNYQFGIFNITVTIRTHNTDFRLTSAIEPTSNIGIVNISVYYGDLDTGTGIDDVLAVFDVENSTHTVTIFESISLGGGFYVIRLQASQFPLGLQTLTVYVNWTGPVYKYQNKTFVTTASIVGLESALTLLVTPGPTPYLENMTYTFFYSDLSSGIGIKNDTGDVFVFVTFQGATVDPSDVTIWEVSQSTQPGNYSVQFNTSSTGVTGLIYMNVFVNWSKGVAPFYANRTDVISVRILPRDTLVSISPPSPTSYNENATFTFTFEDVTGGASILILEDPQLSISVDVDFSYTHAAGTFTISFDTNQFGSLGVQVITLDVEWTGEPFYNNRTGNSVSVNVIARQTFLEYLTPTPTQYNDSVVFEVTWTDITGGASNGITGATVTLYNDTTPINVGDYSVDDLGGGIYNITLDTTYFGTTGTFDLVVEMQIAAFYILDESVSRPFIILERVTVVSADPLPKIPFNSSIEIILIYQDLFTSTVIGNGTGDVTLQITSGSGWIYTVSWEPTFQYYVLTVETYNQAFVIDTPYQMTIEMSYASIEPFYATDYVVVEFELRSRQSSLVLKEPVQTTAYDDNVTFTVVYTDLDSGFGIASATISVFDGITELTQGVDYTLSEPSIGEYRIQLDTAYFGALGGHPLNVFADWSGTPYHDGKNRTVTVIVRERDTTLEVTSPPSQTQYLDNVIFIFEYIDLDAGGIAVTTIDATNIDLYYENGTLINPSWYSVTSLATTYEISINSSILSATTDSNYNLTMVIDWNIADTPFYEDSQISFRVQIVGRRMILEPEQIETTPITGPAGYEIMTVQFSVEDASNGNPVPGAIILFSCQEETLVEGTAYTITDAGGGLYIVDVRTDFLTATWGTGTYHFDVEVQWNPLTAPFYANRSAVILTGTVDLVFANLQADAPQPSGVQISGDVYVLVTYTDLDHDVGIDFASITVTYVDTGLPPLGLTIDPLGGGVYNISFNTLDIDDVGSHALNITALRSNYVTSTAQPSFTVTLIQTSLEPEVPVLQLNWTEIAQITVYFNDTFHGNLTSGATVTWSYGGANGQFSELGSSGVYQADIDTGVEDAGTLPVIIIANRTKFTTSIATVTITSIPLQSDISVVIPDEDVFEVARGALVDITVYLNDTLGVTPIEDIYIDPGDVYITFLGVEYPMTFNTTLGFYEGQIPQGATGALNPRAYDVRLTATPRNYQPVSTQFRILILQSRSQLQYWNGTTYLNDTITIDAVYLQELTFNLRMIAPDFSNSTYTEVLENAWVNWYEARWDLDLNFTEHGDGTFSLTFNTTGASFGTWGITFTGVPDNQFFAETSIPLTLTIRKIPTEVKPPDIPPSHSWGWKGNISFFYNDTFYSKGIAGATVTYSYSTGLRDIKGNATDLGNGTYLVYVDTTNLLPSAQRYTILVNLEKGQNYEARVSGVLLLVTEVETELLVDFDDIFGEFTGLTNNIPTYELTVPFGDSINFSFFYNDTDTEDGYVGGLSGGTSETSLFSDSMGESANPILTPSVGGYYTFVLDTSEGWLYIGTPGARPGVPYTFRVTLNLANRSSATVRIILEIIEIPTSVTIVTLISDLNYGGTGLIRIYYNDTWHNSPITGMVDNITYSSSNERVEITRVYEEGDGYYIIEFTAVAGLLDFVRFAQTSEIKFSIDVENYEAISDIEIDVNIILTPTEETMSTVIPIAVPAGILLLIFLVVYIKVLSVPKMLRKINGQIKALRKGKMPKPVDDVKSRQELIADLYNNTYIELELTRTPDQMPEDSIPVEVPEVGELLVQLSILTNLSPAELDEFKADIAKMRLSEQAAFVKEVIEQEGIRAARKEGKSLEEVLEQVRKDAEQRIAGDETIVERMAETPEAEAEPLILPEEEKVEKPTRLITEEKPEEEGVPIDEEPGLEEDRLAPHEIEDLKIQLIRRGVPDHEIDTIMEQAKFLPRDLVEELLKSLGVEDVF